jgi:hypothetical protein
MKKLIGGAAFLAGLAVLVIGPAAQATPPVGVTSTLAADRAVNSGRRSSTGTKTFFHSGSGSTLSPPAIASCPSRPSSSVADLALGRLERLITCADFVVINVGYRLLETWWWWPVR